MEQKRLSIIGSTGSIGTNTLDIVRRFPYRFRVICLAAGRNVALLAQQIKEFSPLFVSVAGEEERIALKEQLDGANRVEILTGNDGLKEASINQGIDMIVIAISGSKGLRPTYWAVKAGHDIALANKESLVMGGGVITRIAREKEVKLLPVDSEHSAIFQCLRGRKREEVARIILTASGGPFKDLSLDEMKALTPEQALEHPVWQMGKKITIDSSTMMNKGLEVIEAKWLFEIQPEQISVIVHPESIVHSMVEFVDKSVLGLLSIPDMRIPIMNALAFPETIPIDLPTLDLSVLGRLTFFRPDMDKFPCLGLAYQAIKGEESLPIVMNAANEIAVDAFCKKQIGFLNIPRVIKRCMEAHEPQKINSIEDALEIDQWAKAKAIQMLGGG